MHLPRVFVSPLSVRAVDSLQVDHDQHEVSPDRRIASNKAQEGLDSLPLVSLRPLVSLLPRDSNISFRDTWDKSPEERKFLNRLDACLLPYAFLSYLSK